MSNASWTFLVCLFSLCLMIVLMGISAWVINAPVKRARKLDRAKPWHERRGPVEITNVSYSPHDYGVIYKTIHVGDRHNITYAKNKYSQNIGAKELDEV